MTDRNIRRRIVKNSDTGYTEIFGRRGLTEVVQYTRMNIPSISKEERAGLTPVRHLYKTGDKLYKLSHQYYGDTRYWWVIAWWNRKPTDFHCKIGDTIYIPFPLKQALYLANRE
tara:strand:- start:334 stop:675 length:342 start_codon:yes stop_codon:yes gene_type:complete